MPEAEPASRAARRRALGFHGPSIAVVVLASCWLFKGLFGPHPLYTHEGLETYVRVREYLTEFSHGHLIPQVFPDAVRGAGAAFPRFYPPVSYLLSTALAALTGNVVRGVNLSFLLSVVLSGVAMYCLVVAVTRSRAASVAAALLYLSVPYRFVDIFTRGALAESWTFVLFPLILFGLWRTITRRQMAWHLPVTLALLILTHHGVAIYFMPLYAAVAVLVGRREGWRVPAILGGAFLVALLLTLWFVVPQQHAVRQVRAGYPAEIAADVAFNQSNRVPPHKFFGTYTNGWRGYDPPGVVFEGGGCRKASSVQPLDVLRLYCGIDYTLGEGQLGALLLVAGFAGWFTVRRIRTRSAGDERRTRLVWLVAALMATYAFCIAFMVSPKTFLDRLPTIFGYIQLPWRLLAMTAFIAAAAAGIVAGTWVLGRRARYAFVAFAAAVVLLVPTLQRTPNTFGHITGADLTRSLARKTGDRGFTVQGEYLPLAVNPDHPGASLVPAPQVRGGGGRVVESHRHPDSIDARVIADRPATVVFPLLYYDVYQVSSDHGGNLGTFNSRGLLAVRVSPGTSVLNVSRRLAPSSWPGLGLSACGVLVILAIVLRRRRRRPTAPLPPPSSQEDAVAPEADPGDAAVPQGADR